MVVHQVVIGLLRPSPEFVQDALGRIEIGTELLLDSATTHAEIGVVTSSAGADRHSVGEFSFFRHGRFLLCVDAPSPFKLEAEWTSQAFGVIVQVNFISFLIASSPPPGRSSAIPTRTSNCCASAPRGVRCASQLYRVA